MNDCLSHLTLSQYLKSEINGTDLESVTKHLLNCNKCASLLDEIKEHESTFNGIKEQQFDGFQKALQKEINTVHLNNNSLSSENNISYINKYLTKGTLLISIAALLFVTVISGGIFMSIRDNSNKAILDDNSYKGSFAFKVIVKRGDSTFPATTGSTLLAEDSLMFSATTSSKGYLIIAGVDSNDKPMLFFPDSETDKDKDLPYIINDDGYHLLDQSITIDNGTSLKYLVAGFSSDRFNRNSFLHNIKKIVQKNSPEIFKGVAIEVIELEN